MASNYRLEEVAFPCDEDAGHSTGALLWDLFFAAGVIGSLAGRPMGSNSRSAEYYARKAADTADAMMKERVERLGRTETLKGSKE